MRNEIKTPITQETKALLLESIEAAEGPGGCKYHQQAGLKKKIQPCCVVGQYAFRKGVSGPALKAIDNGSYPGITAQWDNLPQVQDAPEGLLFQLQNRWDRACDERVAEARHDMRNIVNSWPVQEG